MTFEHFDEGSAVATLSADDMSRYRIDFDSMSVWDDATRAMLKDMLSMMEHMGLRRYGDTVTVECRRKSDGGCVMRFTVVPSERFRFECGDDVIAAADVGALPSGRFSLIPDGDGFLLLPAGELSRKEKLLLSEFCEPEAE